MTDKPKRKNDQPIPRRYWWIFGMIAVLLWIYPTRILTHWWVNPIIYAVITVGLLIATFGLLRRYSWKRPFFVLVALCVVLASWQVPLSIAENGNCWVEDIRYSKYFACAIRRGEYSDWVHLGGYQQIVDYPIASSGYCYYSAHKPLECLGFTAIYLSPFWLSALGIHFYIGQKRRKAEMLIAEG
jgi:hypothetical protein